MTDQPKRPTRVEVIARDRPFQGYFAVDRYRLRHEQFAGGMGKEISREIFERGHAVGVVPYDPARDAVVLIEQFRAGVFAHGDPEPWLIEVVAGIIEPGEEAEAVARRETEEEAGLTLGRLEELSMQYMSPAGSSESIRFFVGECDSTKAGGLHGLADEGEDIRVFVHSFEETLAMVHDGRIRNAMTTIAILQTAARREALREAWRAH
ncbi:NUDIX domain-containing protein [Marivibrio halodurans]|uniref:ADP-ribose pyrophosphatase n=1 Tax=Marivibrio halodurans TaxID=2039722 RepID=A0A8J7RX11_9PROT|nr:NUDIX domain-containing protein [Marivibrio halodurans]MBP5855985.1 NUDIX domain-containing protein [Marivibrio halodurans]